MCFRRTLFALLAGAVLSLAGCAAPAPAVVLRPVAAAGNHRQAMAPDHEIVHHETG